MEVPDDQRYTFDGGMERLCRCGHALGQHTAERAKSRGQVEQPCLEPDCDCELFKPMKLNLAGAPLTQARFIGVVRSVYRDYSMSVHSAGCRDIRKDCSDHDGHTVELVADTADEAVKVMLDDELREMGYGPEHVKVLPCARRVS